MNLLAFSSLFLATNVPAIVLGVVLGVVVCLAVAAFFHWRKAQRKKYRKRIGQR